MNKFQKFLQGKGISDEAFKAKNAEELAGIYVEYNDAQRAELEKAVEAKASKEDIQDLKREVMQAQADQIKALNDALKAQGQAIKQISDGSRQGKATEAKPLRESIKATVKQLHEMKALGQRAMIEFEFETKAVGTMSITGSVTGDVPQAYREPGMNRIQDRMPFVRDYITNSNITSNVVSWVEQQNREGGPGGTAEGALKNQSDFELVVVEESVKKRTQFTKVTNEMLDDIPYIEGEINNDLMTLLTLDIDNQCLQGDGIGTNLNGIITQATAFAAGAFAGTINGANNYDVLRVAVNQIMLANFMPNVIFCNPTNVTGMQLEKGTDGHYVKFPFVSEDGTRIVNIRIVMNNGVPSDTFLVMDGSRATCFDRSALTIRMGYSDDDFVKNLVTILAEWRGVLRIKGNDVGAFVTGEFSTAKAALETP